MNQIDKRFQYEEQILMKREVHSIKTRMQQIVDHARNGMHPVEQQMLMGQMQQMAQRVLMIRARCAHVFEREHVEREGSWIVQRVCTICEDRQDVSSS